MSNETLEQTAAYEHFSPVFYSIWGSDTEVMAQAQGINDMFANYLYAFGVDYPWQLHPEIQAHLNENSKITINLGGRDE